MEGDISAYLFAIAQDAEQTHYMIPFSGIGSGGTRILYVREVSHDFNTLVGELSKSELLGMLPGSPAETDVTMNDIRISDDNLILICIDLQDGNDGVLILDEDFQKVAYLGGDWAINDPRAVDDDSQGNLYVSSTYGYAVLVFNDELGLIGSVDASDFPDGLIQEDFLPSDIRVKGGKLYILDGRNHYIHVFSTPSS